MQWYLFYIFFYITLIIYYVESWYKLNFFKSKDVASVCQCEVQRWPNVFTLHTHCPLVHFLPLLWFLYPPFFLSFSYLLYLKIIGDPEAQVAEDEEGDNLSARLLVVVLLVNLLLLQVGDEEQLEVHLAISQLTKYTKHP